MLCFSGDVGDRDNNSEAAAFQEHILLTGLKASHVCAQTKVFRCFVSVFMFKTTPVIVNQLVESVG